MLPDMKQLSAGLRGEFQVRLGSARPAGLPGGARRLVWTGLEETAGLIAVFYLVGVLVVILILAIDNWTEVSKWIRRGS